MGVPEESTASVRIELATGGRPESAPAPAPRSPRSMKHVVAPIIGGLLLVGGLIALVMPDDGTPDDGAPSTTVPQQIAGENSIAGSETPRLEDRFDNAELGFFPLQIVEFDAEWFAHGSDAGRGVLYRSVDGLDWVELQPEGLPDGDLVGFERLSGGFAAVVDELSAWSSVEFDQPQDALHRLSFWSSTDAVSWVTDSDRPTVEGVGFPFPVQLSENASAITIVEPVEPDPDGPLVRYLEPVMSAIDARRTCSAQSRLDVDNRVYDFLDCNDELVLTTAAIDIPELVSRPSDPTLCVETLHQQMQQRNVTRIVRTNGSEAEIDLGVEYGLFGQFFNDSYISLASAPNASNASACFEDDASTIQGEIDGGLLWRTDVGPTRIDVPGVRRGDDVRALRRAADGRAMTSGLNHAYVSAYPYVGWSEANATAQGDQLLRLGPISISADGGLLMGYSTANWYFADPDSATWLTIEAGGPAAVLLSTDDFAIVMNDRSDHLYKVPLTGLLR